MKNKHLLLVGLSMFSLPIFSQQVDYSVPTVPQETGLNLQMITSDNDYVCQPIVKRNRNGVSWLSNRIIQISPDGLEIAYVSSRDNTTNVFIKDLSRKGFSVQRTKRSGVVDFSYSPDGRKIVFSEQIGKTSQIFETDAKSGYVCRQITTQSQDYTPTYSRDMSHIYFTRQEINSFSIWSYNFRDNSLSTFAAGLNPCPVNQQQLLCTRSNADGRCEIWRINESTGVEECLVADTERSFTTPALSPDGKWILFVGSSKCDAGNGKFFWNTDIYVCRIDGSDMHQLTYHAADDLSPVWSANGKSIYFISQRGSANGTENIWKMNFNY